MSKSSTFRFMSPPPPGNYNLIIDKQTRKSLGRLRTMPLLQRMGHIKFTFAYTWHKLALPLITYKYVHAHEGISEDHLVCITNQKIETKSYSIKPLLHCAVSKEKIGNFTLVTDSRDFTVRGWVRPVIELRHVQYRYKDLLRTYQLRFFGEDFTPTLKDTENLFFQEMAWVTQLISEKSERTTQELFVFDGSTCFLPSWDLLIYLARTETTFRKIKTSLSFWVERTKTLEKISNRIWEAVRRFDYDTKEIIKKRKEYLKKFKPQKMKNYTLSALKEIARFTEWEILRNEFFL